jgi:hypothetical protein
MAEEIIEGEVMEVVRETKRRQQQGAKVARGWYSPDCTRLSIVVEWPLDCRLAPTPEPERIGAG